MTIPRLVAGITVLSLLSASAPGLAEAFKFAGAGLNWQSGSLKQAEPCPALRRPLNPSANADSETTLNRYFRLAFDAETGGDFDTAIINYRRAARTAPCACDRSHAQAGEQAAREAKAVAATGAATRPTQFFWSRLQELTASLSCVRTQ